MSFTPRPLRALGQLLVAMGAVNLGVVGNKKHIRGYHLGRDRVDVATGEGTGRNDYSIQLPRDRLGLTNAASAIDIGRVGGMLPRLRSMSLWLVREWADRARSWRRRADSNR